MPETTDLSELIARVEGASGPDTGLDGDIVHALDLVPPGFFQRSIKQRYLWSDGGPGLRARTWLAPEYTASIDAAMALVERVRPGWVIRLDSYGKHASVGIEPPWTGEMLPSHSADAATPALALILALLKSLSLEPSQ